jgi:hypothetical protein
MEQPGLARGAHGDARAAAHTQLVKGYEAVAPVGTRASLAERIKQVWHLERGGAHLLAGHQPIQIHQDGFDNDWIVSPAAQAFGQGL